LSLAAPGNVKPAHDAKSEWSRREWSRWDASDMDEQTREGEASGGRSPIKQCDMDKRSAAESREVGTSSQKASRQFVSGAERVK
jgi:hypothetical protein